ncbi:DinB family protein [Sphingobacterium sp.]|uniref:DinB family protein n=1 Tax=Sphingobacterium sp. TaxID=341027 RepID=UPI0028974D1B|nr:DinB family protein [Sphingobacterium sp.]
MQDSIMIKDALWSQFGASLDMLENAIHMCPDEHWDTALDFWYLSFHCIFWTDYYLSVEPNKFEPPKPFTFSEFDPTGKKPDRTYIRSEILAYLEYCRQKARKHIEELTPSRMNARWINESKNFSYLEILLYNMRHIQHHVAQLNLYLRQAIDRAPKWVSQVKE